MMSIRLPTKKESSVRRNLVTKTPPNSLRSTQSSKTISAKIEPAAESFILIAINYFHPYTRREFCDEILTEEGDFLVRKGRLQNEYVLSVRSQAEIKHIKANTNPSGLLYFCFTEVAFTSLSQLVATHFNSKLPIAKDAIGTIYIVRPIPVPPWVFKPDNINVLDFVGRGSTCDVWRGTLMRENNQSEQVALKIPRSSDTEQSWELLHEARILRVLKHPHVVAWRGIVNKGNEIMLVLEFVKHGTLAHLLRKLTNRGKIKGCLDVAKGLHYLHNNQLIHRNIATRNCLCDFEENSQLVVKISDLCLCRGGGDNVAYKLDTVHAIPPGWTAPESLSNLEWSAASDVWSYGVVLWEIFSENKSPYKAELKKVTMESVKNYLLTKNRLVPPKEMPPKITDLMNLCFSEKPDARPDTRAIVEQMQSIYDSTNL